VIDARFLARTLTARERLMRWCANICSVSTVEFRKERFMQSAQFDQSTTDRLYVRDGRLSRRSLMGGLAAGSLAAGIGGVLRFAPPVAAQDSTPAAAGPAPAHRLSVGQIEVIVFDDGTFMGPADLFAVNASEPELTETLAAQGLTPADPIPVSVHPLLVETGDQRVLLDTGLGFLNDPPGRLLDSLAAEGIAPEDIDVVLITHMHTDHFGGGLDAAGALTFPNARYLIHGVEYEFWAAEPSLDELIVPDDFKQVFRQAAKDGLTAMQDTIEQIAPGDEIAPGVTVVDAKGHTPGHLAVEISSDGEGMIHIVDAAHLPEFHLTHPEWFMVADNYPAWSITTRKMLFDRAADENLLVSTYHFPFPGLGRVAKDEIGWVWTPEG
jgi:glyoxylase-like metal-dependent hydrolase (beta-lactamase superfamily II)